MNESTGELFAVKQISLTRGLKDEINTLQTEIDLMKDLDHRYVLPSRVKQGLSAALTLLRPKG